MPDIQNTVDTVKDITARLIENNVTFSFRHYKKNGKLITEFFSKDARNCMLLFPRTFKIGYDNRQTEIATCVI
jgi:hypothetical protein